MGNPRDSEEIPFYILRILKDLMSNNDPGDIDIKCCNTIGHGPWGMHQP